MYERQPAFLGHDFNIDWNPRPGWEGMRNPIHVAALNWMGINIVECLDLEQAATMARKLNRYEFLMTFAPLPVEGGTGSPLNPLAVCPAWCHASASQSTQRRFFASTTFCRL